MSVAPQVHSTPQPIAHADPLGGSIAHLTELLRGPLRGVFGGVHVGLQADGNDVELLERTGVGRDVNRHHYQASGVETAIRRPAVQAQLSAVRMRAWHPAFGGAFTQKLSEDVLTLQWSGDAACATLQIDFRDLNHRPTSAIDGRQATVDDVMAIPEIASAWDATAGSAS